MAITDIRKAAILLMSLPGEQGTEIVNNDVDCRRWVRR